MSSLERPPIDIDLISKDSDKMANRWRDWIIKLYNRVGGTLGGNAPDDATYITQTANSDLSAEQALSTLSSGFVKVTTGSGVLSSTGNTTIQTADIGNSQVTAVKLINAGVFTGDISGTFPATTVAKINGVTLGSTTATDRNILIADGTQWVTRAVSGDATIGNTGTLTLATSGVTAASYGLHIATYDTKGRATSATTRTITGTSNKIDVTNGDGVSGNPTVTISSSYAGQNSITTVGTITSGTWNGTAIANSYLANSDVANLSGTNTGDQSIFKTIAVSGQSDVVADSTADTLTLVAGSNITITTNAGTDSITIASAAPGTGTVTSVSVTTANGVSGSVADATTTPAISLTLGAITPTSVNFGGSTLANYVEGTWTPTVTLVGGAGNTVPVYSTNTGRYTRIGNRVFVDVKLAGDGGNEGAGTGLVTIDLPITASASSPSTTVGAHTLLGQAINGSTNYLLIGRIGASATTLSLRYMSSISANASFTGVLQNDTSREIQLSFCYEV